MVLAALIESNYSLLLRSAATLYTLNLSVSLKKSAASFSTDLLQTEEVEYLVLEAVVTMALTLKMEEFIYMV